MKRTGFVAARELSSLFVSPTAYVVLTLWAVLAGVFFLSNLIDFQMQLVRLQQFGQYGMTQELNLNDQLLMPFFGSMWIVLLFLVPGVTMGLFAQEKANGTEELLLTSPLTIWEIVLGKFLAGLCFVLIMTTLVAFFPGVLFIYGDPELGKTAAGLLGLFLVSATYVALGAFASSVTRNQLIAFVLAIVMILVQLMLPYLADSRGAPSEGVMTQVMEGVRWLSPAVHYEQLLKGLVDTGDLAHFAVVIGIFLVLTKASLESVRWR
jgi:ABC-2 type transport system permease protein